MERFETLQQVVVPILQPYIRSLAVFGSYARGEETAESDIDLLIELKPVGERPSLGLKWFGLEQELSQLLGRNVELVSENALSPYIRPQVTREKVILYDEQG